MTPSFSSTGHHQGPWPACVEQELSGIQCEQLILAYVDDIIIEIIKPMDDVQADFRINRVRIFVNETNYVTKIPERG